MTDDKFQYEHPMIVSREGDGILRCQYCHVEIDDSDMFEMFDHECADEKIRRLKWEEEHGRR